MSAVAARPTITEESSELWPEETLDERLDVTGPDR